MANALEAFKRAVLHVVKEETGRTDVAIRVISEDEPLCHTRD
jgi:hypothetical protein